MVNAELSPVIRFSKMHGAGNDFVVLDLRTAPAPSPALCRILADRHTGVGCDLILGVEAPRSAFAVASYRIWTADGSPSPQCGNGARCVAAWVSRAGITREPRFALDSPSGTLMVDALSGQSFRIAMGAPQFAPQKIPLLGYEVEQDVYEADVGGGLRLHFAAVSMGNPHAVIDVEEISRAPVLQAGQALQNSRYFPNSVNVGFAEVVSRDLLRLRVYEYGAGETLACGTGACAAAAVLMRRGRIDRSASVELPGGVLQVSWADDEAPMMLTGPAAFVFDGDLSSSLLAANS
jgi:diaminopimelate epimerase/O-ureido-serine racemase